MGQNTRKISFSTRAPIYKKCRKLGIGSKNTHRTDFDISKSRRKWSIEEIDIVRKNYSKLPLDDVCALLPNRTKNMVISQARRLDLMSFNREKMLWKSEDIDYIMQNWEITPDKVMADNLKRTFRAVKAKREEMGLYRFDMNSSSYHTLSKYLRGHIQEWKRDSMKSCEYKCVLTGSKDFEIHHLYGVSNMIDDIFNEYPQYKNISFDDYLEEDLSFLLCEFLKKQDFYPLGVCIDKKLHTLFHSMYGQYYNTPEQWYQFCEDYRKGIYNKYI